MATTTNGIATEGEAKTKISSSASVTTDLLITKARVYEIGGDVDNANSYESNQCVKYSDILALYNWYLANNLADPYQISSSTEPDINDRLDATPIGFNGYNAEYGCLSIDDVVRYYPLANIGDPVYDIVHQVQNIYTPSSWAFELFAVSNCYLELAYSSGVGVIPQTVSELASSQYIQGQNNTNNDLTDYFSSINSVLNVPPYTYQYNILGQFGPNIVPYIEDPFSPNQSYFTKYFQLNSSQKFSVIYNIDGYLSGINQIDHLPATYVITFADFGGGYSFEELQVSNMSFNTGYICYDSELVFYDVTTKPSSAIFEIHKEVTTGGLLIITFTKCADITLPLPYVEYYLVAFRPEVCCTNFNTSYPTTLAFWYTNAHEISELGQQDYGGVDYWAMYDIKLSDSYYTPDHRPMDIHSLSLTQYVGVPGTILTNQAYGITYNTGDMYLTYNRGILDLKTYDDDGSSGLSQTSFQSDSELKHHGSITVGNDIGYIILDSGSFDTLTEMDPTIGCVEFKSGWWGIPETAYEQYFGEAPDIIVTEFPRAIQISIKLPQGLIDYLWSNSVPFYLYYRNYYYQFVIS